MLTYVYLKQKFEGMSNKAFLTLNIKLIRNPE